MILYRLTRVTYADSLSGKGAAIYGNRWNSKGVEMLYTAQNRALAMAEVMVHLDLDSLPSDYMMVEIYVPDETSCKSVTQKELDEHWNSNLFITQTQKIGDTFIHEREYCMLKVPSAVVKGEINYVINTTHKEFKNIKIISASNFPFDNRIFKG